MEEAPAQATEVPLSSSTLCQSSEPPWAYTAYRRASGHTMLQHRPLLLMRSTAGPANGE